MLVVHNGDGDGDGDGDGGGDEIAQGQGAVSTQGKRSGVTVLFRTP
eukprot:COSAG02_NODE_11468_length_1709_cov_0.975926_2_plen_45_part_01